MWSCSALNARLLNKLKFLQIKKKACVSNIFKPAPFRFLKANKMSSFLFSCVLNIYNNKNKSVTV